MKYLIALVLLCALTLSNNHMYSATSKKTQSNYEKLKDAEGKPINPGDGYDYYDNSEAPGYDAQEFDEYEYEDDSNIQLTYLHQYKGKSHRS